MPTTTEDVFPHRVCAEEDDDSDAFVACFSVASVVYKDTDDFRVLSMAAPSKSSNVAPDGERRIS